MGHVKLEYVIRYSSQDEYFKADNMLRQQPEFRPWLCSPHDKSGHLEAEFQLETASFIEFIDIGNFGSSTIEIQVGKSEFLKKTTYKSFLPTVSMLPLSEINAGASFNSVYMFNKGNINKLHAEEAWDRIKVICSQPFKKKMQFGLSFLCLHTTKLVLKSDVEEPSSVDTSNKRPSKFYSNMSSNDTSFASVKSRGEKLLKASKSRSFMQNRKKKLVDCRTLLKVNSSQPLRSPLMFREDARNFLIVCHAEDSLIKSPQYYMDEFTRQSNQVLTFQEQQNFLTCYFEILNNYQELYGMCEPHDKVEIEAEKKDDLLDLSNTREAKPSKKMPISPKKGNIIRLKKFVQPQPQASCSQQPEAEPTSPSPTSLCPICGKCLPLNSIREHAWTCRDSPVLYPAFSVDISSLSTDAANDPSIFIPPNLAEDNNVPCPLCMLSFNTSEVENHTANCSFLSKYKYC